MIQRHKRRKALTDFERERFAGEAGEMHRKLMSFTLALSPLSDDYKAISRFHDALLQAIRDVTGEEPEWTRTPRSAFPRSEKP